MTASLVLIPLIASLGVITVQSVRVAKLITLCVTLVVLQLCVYVWLLYEGTTCDVQFPSFTGTAFEMGIDGLALYYVVLTGLLIPLCVLASWVNVTRRMQGYMATLLVIEAILMAVFTVRDILAFYVSFEAVLIPLFYMVGTWGGSDTRVRAALLLFLYTLVGSLFMLLAILHLYNMVGSTSLNIIAIVALDASTQVYLFIGFAIALLVKTPMVPFHIWLPRAHSEAPVAGSMLLAGVVLKLSTYGFLRVVIPLLPDATALFTPYIITLCMVSLVYSSLATLRQSDVKALVAYSSIGHIAVVIIGLFSNNLIGLQGAYLLSVAHGLVSPAIFILVGGVLYDRTHTRIIRYYHGLGLYMPVFASLFFVASCANIGVPLSLNWLSEILSLAGLYQSSPLVAVIGASGIVLSSCYSIWVYTRMVGGGYAPMMGYIPDITRREFSVLLPLLLLTVVLGIYPAVILEDVHVPLSTLVYSV